MIDYELQFSHSPWKTIFQNNWKEWEGGKLCSSQFSLSNCSITLFFLEGNWSLNSGIHACNEIQSILLWLFWRWGLISWPGIFILVTSTFQIARITGVNHWSPAQLLFIGLNLYKWHTKTKSLKFDSVNIRNWRVF
jgi:hypothetical protein